MAAALGASTPSDELRIRALCAADASRGTCSAKEDLEGSGSRTLSRIGGRVAQCLYGKDFDAVTGLKGTKMLNGALWLREQALKRVCPPSATNEVALTQFVLKEVRAEDFNRLKRCIKVGMLSAVFDVLFSKGAPRVDVLNKTPAEVVETFFGMVVQKKHMPILRVLLDTPAYMGRMPADSMGRLIKRAAVTGCIEPLRVILSHKDTVDGVSSIAYHVAIARALYTGHFECATALLEKKKKVAELPDENINNLFRYCARDGHHVALEIFLTDKHLSPRISAEQLSSSLSLALEKNHIASTLAVLDSKRFIDVATEDVVGKPFLYASALGRTPSLHKIVSQKELVACISGRTLEQTLFSTAARGQTESLRLIMSCEELAGQILPKTIRTMVSKAANNGRFECIQEIFSHPDLIARTLDKEFIEALAPAVRSGSIEEVQAILRRL